MKTEFYPLIRYNVNSVVADIKKHETKKAEQERLQANLGGMSK